MIQHHRLWQKKESITKKLTRYWKIRRRNLLWMNLIFFQHTDCNWIKKYGKFSNSHSSLSSEFSTCKRLSCKLCILFIIWTRTLFLESGINWKLAISCGILKNHNTGTNKNNGRDPEKSGVIFVFFVQMHFCSSIYLHEFFQMILLIPSIVFSRVISTRAYQKCVTCQEPIDY